MNLNFIIKKDFIQRILEEEINLQFLKSSLTPYEIFGIALIIFSYIIGWPAVGAFGIVAVYYKEPLIFAIGGPLIYAFSYLVLIAGIYIAGKERASVVLKFFMKKFLEKFLARKAGKAQPVDH